MEKKQEFAEILAVISNNLIPPPKGRTALGML